MWIIIVSFCAAYDGGTKCGSFIPPKYFQSGAKCALEKPSAYAGVIGAIDALEGTPIMVKIQCENLGASA